MKKRPLLFLAVIVVMVILISGCQSLPTGQGDESGGINTISGCYKVEFLGVTETSEVTSTWRYHVQEQACAEDLSSWMLELPACASVVDASPTPWGVLNPDPYYAMSGIQWQTGTDFRDGDFQVMLTGDLKKGVTRAGVQGKGITVGSLEGPICKDVATPTAAGPRPSPVPKPSPSPVAGAVAMAKVKVQSTYCRGQPAGKSARVILLYRSQEAQILGRNDDPNNPWWYVNISAEKGNCWLWGKAVTTSGNLDALPIVK
jgi:hypothetical protein